MPPLLLTAMIRNTVKYKLVGPSPKLGLFFAGNPDQTDLKPRLRHYRISWFQQED